MTDIQLASQTMDSLHSFGDIIRKKCATEVSSGVSGWGPVGRMVVRVERGSAPQGCL